jgi:hypothetical protein
MIQTEMISKDPASPNTTREFLSPKVQEASVAATATTTTTTMATQKLEANVVKSATSLGIVEVGELNLQTKWLCVITLPNPFVAENRRKRPGFATTEAIS